MTPPTLLIAIYLLVLSLALCGQDLDHAEVRLPYAELKQLLARAAPPDEKPPALQPALLAARLRFSIDHGRPVIDATFRITSFSTGMAVVALLDGDVALETQEPKDAAVIMAGKTFCLAVDKPGIRSLQLRLLPILSKNRFTLQLPACPSAIFETGELPADQSVVLGFGENEEALAAGQSRPLANTGQPLTIRLLDRHETREALRPPEPSSWTWQNQVLVQPAEGDLLYQVSASAAAAGGSGVEALLPLPADARDLTVTGDDLLAHTKIRGDQRALSVKLVWKTRGILDRQVTLSYRLPLRPLDRVWQLQAPGGAETRTRFIIATTPLLAYAAEGLTAKLTPQGLPAEFAKSLQGTTCQHLEAAITAELGITPIPVAAIAEGVVTSAEWSLKIEPDGAMLATGVLAIAHKNPLDFLLDTPPGMKLLACEVGGKAVAPVDLGSGVLKVTLTPQAAGSRLLCSFTGRTDPLDPVEGTLSLALPKVPLFIDALIWRLDLPAGYQAETHGNLTRPQTTTAEPSARITLKKNFCRDERPETQLFYQRSDLNR